MKINKYKVLDIFSGCGGMSWGLHKAGFDVVAGVDNWEPALNTFKLNHPDALIYNKDIRELNPEDVMNDLGLKKGELDVIVGGPPCQGFSKNVPSSYRFLEDPRNQLYKNYLAFVKALFPKVCVIENVAEIYNAFDGIVRNQIIHTLQSWGYDVEVRVLFAPDYGVPQRRSRCFFFATRTGVKPEFPQPTHSKKAKRDLFSSQQAYVSAWDAINDLPRIENGGGSSEMNYTKEPTNDFQKFMRKDADILYDHITRELKGVQLQRIQSIKAGQGFKDLPDSIRPRSGYSGAYGRLDFENVAQTITRWCFHIGSGRYGHPLDARLISTREAARLQCFTDDFRFTGTFIEKAAQIGNAVPPLLMYRLAPFIKMALE